jgi:hypothetical protein
MNTSYRISHTPGKNNEWASIFAICKPVKLKVKPIRSSELCGCQKKAKNDLVVKINYKQKQYPKLRTYTKVESKFSSIVF